MNEETAPIIQLKNVSKSFGALKALDGVNFDLSAGEVHCLAGMNGCGKSTLIKLISGVHAPDPGGYLQIFGHNYPEGSSPSEARSHGISVIWQDLALFDTLTVWENVVFDSFVGHPLAFLRSYSLRRKAEEVLDRVEPNRTFTLDSQVKDLSISSKQIVAICRSLMTEARVIFMDEPTASLTEKESHVLLRIIERLSASGVAIVFVSHRLEQVLQISDRVSVMRDGKITGTFPADQLNVADLTREMTGYDIVPGELEQVSGAETVLEVNSLRRDGEYEDISFSLKRGEVLGLTGRLGSGRTELAKTLFGMTKPHEGSFSFKGKVCTFRSNRDAIEVGIGYLSEDRLSIGLDQKQSISDNIVLPISRTLARLGFLTPARRGALARQWIDKLEIKMQSPNQPVNALSGGNQQRVAIAKWSAIGPDVLILDSPTVGVDVHAKEGIFWIIRDFAVKGVAILLITDEIDEATNNSHRVLVMDEGRFILETGAGAGAQKEIEEAMHND